jgi:hypothetical protein
MTVEYLTELARQWVAEQGEDASTHLANAIRELRAVGDARGAALLAKIAQRVELIDDPMQHGGRRTAIRRHRYGQFDPSA